MLQLERIIDLISSLNSEGTVDSISLALAELSKILRLDRCVLRNRIGTSDKFGVISEWYAEGLLPIDVLEPEMDSQASINLVQQLLIAGEVKINDIYAEPGFSEEEIQKAKNWGCRAILFIPLRYQNAINGIIVAIQSAEAREWSREDKHCTQLLGETALAVWLHNQALKALSDSKQEYQWAVDASNDAIWDWNLVTGRADFSHRFYQMLGYDPGLVVIDSDLFRQLIHPDDFVFIEHTMNGVQQSLQKSSSIEFRMITRTGDLLWLRSNGRIVERDDSGRPVRMVGTYSDITTFKKTLQQLELARQNADRANVSKSEFLARMSHEVRTPLNAIMGMLHLIKDAELSDSLLEKVQIMQDSSKQLLTVLNDVLDFSRIESGKLELENIPFSIDELTQQVFAMLAIKAEEKGLLLLLEFSPDTPAMLMGDPNRLAQILTNLIANAIKFTEQGEVALNIAVKKRAGDRIDLEFSVSDTGIGIRDDEMSVLFSSFAQAKRSIAREYGGSGLGLSICKSLVELMDGNIYVESNYGVGSTFRFTVQMQVPGKTGTVFSDNLHCKNKRVLLLGSKPRVAESYAPLFSGMQMPVDFFNLDNGLDAQLSGYLAAGSFDIVLLDTCANADSDEMIVPILYHLLAKNPGMPVFVIAAFLSANLKALVDMGSAVRFIGKPLTPQKLVNFLSPKIMTVNEASVDVELSDRDKLRLSRMKVMLVEDNAVNRMIAVGMLKKYGVTVLEMEQGGLAVDWVFANNLDDIHAILMDIEMPVMDGYLATMQIRRHQQGKYVPIIAMTANTLNTDVEKCYQYGMNAHISKPVDPQKLFLTLLDFAPVPQ